MIVVHVRKRNFLESKFDEFEYWEGGELRKKGDCIERKIRLSIGREGKRIVKNKRKSIERNL